MSADQFWTAIAAQIEELGTARSADDVVRILDVHRIPGNGTKDSAADGFFAGSGGDKTVESALWVAGWKLKWWTADYYYCMQAPDGSSITYVEGDIYRGNNRDSAPR